ncbi:LapA family protein [Lactococcus garvieae]|uniref:LapA family protein n=1 Tax=Lactococcus garvieae TaxID=1363 RepID=UPI00254CFBF0|nr:LapA family protein [Lactococcus garvieae]
MEKLKKVLTPKRILFLIVFILVIVFALKNMSPATISFIFFSVKLPVLVLILGMYALGVFTGWAVKRSDVKKIVDDAQDETKREINDLKDQIKK